MYQVWKNNSTLQSQTLPVFESKFADFMESVKPCKIHKQLLKSINKKYQAILVVWDNEKRVKSCRDKNKDRDFIKKITSLLKASLVAKCWNKKDRKGIWKTAALSTIKIGINILRLKTTRNNL